MRIKHLITLFFIMALVISACNLPDPPQEGLSIEDQAATLVAQTLQAAQAPSQVSILPITPGPQVTPSLAATGTVTTTVTITPTYSLPQLTIIEDTNCRTGPGQDYEIVVVLKAGNKTEILGRSTSGNYWVVKNPSGGSPCWIWGEYSTTSGSTHLLPSMTPPPTATLHPAAAPSNLKYNFSCVYNGAGLDVTTALEWSDNARNEKGYRIYRNGTNVIELPANATSYTETAAIDLGQTVSYSVEAFNDTGPSGQAKISFTCQ